MDQDNEFIETVATMAETSMGMSRLTGKIWAVLLATDKVWMSAEELMAAVGSSRGSVSTILRSLESLGLVQRSSLIGSKRRVYRVPPASSLLDIKRVSLERMRKLMAQGLRGMDATRSVARERLGEYHDFMVFFQQEFEALAERWNNRSKESSV
jgi:predicted transcriptional regulator